MNTDSRDEHFRTVSDSYGRWFAATKGPGLFPVDNSCCLGHVAWRAPCHLLPIKKECRVTKCTLDDCGNCEGRYRIVECCSRDRNQRRISAHFHSEIKPREAQVFCKEKRKPKRVPGHCNGDEPANGMTNHNWRKQSREWCSTCGAAQR
ncbi:hypothetical protein ACOME3_004258 [Neoechinorhynchus agilis]